MSENDNSNEGGTNSEITNVYDSVNNILMNPSIIVILVVVVLIYLALFMSLGASTNTNDSDSTSNTGASKAMMIIIVGVFIVLIIINGLQYFFGVDIVANIQNIFSGEPEVDISVDNSRFNSDSTVPEIKLRKQVFNIPGNNYVYPDAKSLCTAYGADLATYKQIEDAYNKGAEWCNYGWSDGQMALYPTQKSTFDKLQGIKGHEHDCGRPGINGGYIANQEVKFGINCYGHKPQISDEEKDLMNNSSPYPQTVYESAFQKKVDYWKDHVDDILVSPFNYNSWSKI